VATFPREADEGAFDEITRSAGLEMLQEKSLAKHAKQPQWKLKIEMGRRTMLFDSPNFFDSFGVWAGGAALGSGMAATELVRESPGLLSNRRAIRALR
jgi:hypothetical protein